MRPILLASSALLMLQLVHNSNAQPTGDLCRRSTFRLDLSKPRPREQQLTAVPGSGGSSVGGVPPYALPLAVRLISVLPNELRLGKRIEVQMLLENVGKSALFL